MNDHYHLPVRADQDPQRAKEAQKVTIVGIVVNVILAIGKFFAGWLGSSTALIADAVHSLSDLATDAVVLVSIRIASHGADEDHPYGHGRAETIGTAIVGGVLVFVGIALVTGVAEKLLEGSLLTPTWPALVGASASIILNEGLYHYTVRVGRKHDNETIIANAWHHRSDSLSSIAALIGVGGAMMGFPILDPLAAIVVVYMIVKVGWEIATGAVQELMDTTAPPEKLDEIRSIITKVDGVRRSHELRTRRVGADLFIDVHILVAPYITVSEAHNIAETVRESLKKAAGVTDALVHIDAEDDIHYKIVDIDRVKMEASIRERAEKIEGIDSVGELSMHMLNGKLCVDFSVDVDDSVTFKEAKEKIENLRQQVVSLGNIDAAVIKGRLTKTVTESGFINPPTKKGEGDD